VNKLDSVSYQDSLDQPSQERAVISVRDVTMCFLIVKRYREWVFSPLSREKSHTALRHTTLEIQAGDRIAIMGPNGAG
jgi:ABC-type polysaccharide/polyol phosphate transport system ATPase subunit